MATTSKKSIKQLSSSQEGCFVVYFNITEGLSYRKDPDVCLLKIWQH